MPRSGVFDGWDWNTHPALFGYAATLVVLIWVIWRLLMFIERILGIGRGKPPTPGQEGEGQDDSAEGLAEPPSEG